MLVLSKSLPHTGDSFGLDMHPWMNDTLSSIEIFCHPSFIALPYSVFGWDLHLLWIFVWEKIMITSVSWQVALEDKRWESPPQWEMRLRYSRMVMFSPTILSLASGNLGLLSYQKTTGRNYAGDFTSDCFQSLSFKHRMQLDVCSQRQSKVEDNQLEHWLKRRMISNNNKIC